MYTQVVQVTQVSIEVVYDKESVDLPAVGVACSRIIQFYNLGHTHLYDKESVDRSAVGVA